jgi:Gnt-I system high-affinity gluconate transporter
MDYIGFFGEAPVALLIALILAIVLLGPNIGRAQDKADQEEKAAATDSDGGTTTPRPDGAGGAATATAPAPTAGAAAAPRSWLSAAMESCNEAVKPIAMIIMVIGAGGAFKEVLVKSGIADYIGDLTHGWNISPLILAWGIAALVRIAVGSASVAVVTAAGIVLPLLHNSNTVPELMVLAVTCGSIAASHVNDPGFWLFKQYLNLSVLDTIKIRTSYTSALAVLGLGGVLLMNTVVG